jgi:hypothetical protein
MEAVDKLAQAATLKVTSSNLGWDTEWIFVVFHSPPGQMLEQYIKVGHILSDSLVINPGIRRKMSELLTTSLSQIFLHN